MKKQIQNLISEYEQRIRDLGYDQRTDDAMSSEAYKSVVATLENVIVDLKKIEASED